MSSPSCSLPCLPALFPSQCSQDKTILVISCLWISYLWLQREPCVCVHHPCRRLQGGHSSGQSEAPPSGCSPRLKTLHLITSAKSRLPCEVTHSRVLGIGTWMDIFGGLLSRLPQSRKVKINNDIKNSQSDTCRVPRGGEGFDGFQDPTGCLYSF